MIKHIVMWKLNEQQRQSGSRKIKALLEGMQGKVEGLRHLEVGLNTIEDPSACDLVLCAEFESESALQAYQVHPEHLKIKEFVAPIRISRHQVDYEC